ncbi:c-type cytochrome domain-containing protein [Bacteroidota bacterium]
MIKTLLCLTGISLSFFGLTGCVHSQPASSESSSSATFESTIQPIFNAKCTACHGSTRAAEGLNLQSWSQVFAGGDDGEAIIPYDSGNSLLMELVTLSTGLPHPAEFGKDTLTVDEVESIRSWIDAGAIDTKGNIPYEHSTHLLYVCNEDDAAISVVDMDANLVIRTVDLQTLGFSPNAKPHHTAVEPDGTNWYVSLIGDDAVLKFNRQNELVGRADFERPGLLLIDPHQDLLLVGHSMKAVNPPQRVGSINRVSMEVEELDVFIPRPHALALSKDGRFLYTASLAANQVVTMNRETEQVDLYNIPGPIHTLVQFAASPDGSTLAVGGQMTGRVLFFDITSPDAPVVFDSVLVSGAPWHPVYSKDGALIYLGNKAGNKVTVIDAKSRKVAAEISGRGIAQPHGSALSADGDFLYISNNNLNNSYTPRYDLGDNASVGTVAVIDTRSRRIVKVIEVGRNATGLGVAASE